MSSMIRMMGKMIGEVGNRNRIRRNGFIRCIMGRIWACQVMGIMDMHKGVRYGYLG